MTATTVRPVVFLALASAALFAAVATHASPGADGDPEKGKAVFEKCAACHSVDDAKSDGPALKGMFGRKAGSLEDYRYSAAMIRSGIVWDRTTLDAYVANPQGYIKGNRMAFAGIADKAEREDLVAYLERATKPD
jgi:cytochrome c